MPALAATRNVPGSYPTIQAAITAASAGDTILVAPGTYTEFVDVNKANLVILSTGGAAVTKIENNVNNDTPIVNIAAPGVILGGPAQGFTINQKDPGPSALPFGGNCAVRVVGESASSATEPGTVTIRNCRLTGNQTDQGILVNKNLTNAHLIVQDCVFEKNAGTFGFMDCILFNYTNPGGGLNTNVAANQCTIDLLNLTATAFENTAVNFNGTLHRTTLNITAGSYTGTANANYGLYILDDVHNSSAINITGATFKDVGSGIYVADELGDQSTGTISNLTLTNFRSYGIYMGYVYAGGQLRVTGSTLAGNGTTAHYGVYTDTQYNSTTLIDGNIISGVDQYGAYETYPYSGSSYTVTNNQISLYSSGSSGYGVYTETEYNSHTVVRGNTITGFNYAGVYDDYPYAGSSGSGGRSATTVIESNTLTGAAGGADYGIYVYGPYYGCQASVINNTASNFDWAGVYIEYIYYGSDMAVSGNTLSALSSSGSKYGIYVYELGYQSTLALTGNSVTGFTDKGLELYETYYDSEATVTDNVLAAHGSGAAYGIYAYDVYDGGAATFTGNQVSGFGNTAGTEYGFYNDEVYDGAHLTLSNNTFSAHSAHAEYGFYSGSGFQDGATVSITGNTFTGFTDYGFYTDYLGYDGCDATVTGNTFTAAAGGADYGLYVNGYVDYGTTALIANNTIDGFTDYGLYVSGVNDGSSLTVQNNRLTAVSDGAGDQYGIYYSSYTNLGSVSRILGNTITGIADQDGGGASRAYGIQPSGATGGSVETVADNVVDAVPGGITFGIYCNYVADYASTFELLRNKVSGFSYCQVYLNDDTDTGGNTQIADNRFTGGEYGIYYSGSSVGGGADFKLERNTIAEFTDTGVYFDSEIWGCSLEISLNRILGTGANAAIGFHENAHGINSGAQVSVLNNCLGGVDTGLILQSVADTSWLIAHGNDFAGVSTTGIDNESGDVAHTVNAENNYFAAVTPATGNVDTTPALAASPDEDGDGVTNCSDICPSTAAGQSVDADGCSCLQLHPTANADGDAALDCNDGCPADPAKTESGQCGCGVADTDTDGDGTADCVDGCPSDPGKTAPGACGCGSTDVDSDGDGTPNCVDACSADPAKNAPGICGCGVADTDTDGDGIANCVDSCPDEAGIAEQGGCPEEAPRPTPGCGAVGPSMLLLGIAGLTGLGLVRRRRH